MKTKITLFGILLMALGTWTFFHDRGNPITSPPRTNSSEPGSATVGDTVAPTSQTVSVLAGSTWNSNEFESELGWAYFALIFKDGGKVEWKAMRVGGTEPMFSYEGDFSVQENTITFVHLNGEEAVAVLHPDGNVFNLTSPDLEEAIKFTRTQPDENMSAKPDDDAGFTEIDPGSLPKAVAESAAKQFPDYTVEDAVIENDGSGLYSLALNLKTMKGQTAGLTLDSKGVVRNRSIAVQESDLPDIVLKGLRDKYGHYDPLKILDVSRDFDWVDGNQQESYTIQISVGKFSLTRFLVIDMNGRIISDEAPEN